MDYMAESLKRHAQWKGKIEITARVPVSDRESLSVAYTPGVAAPCLAIRDDPALSFELTRRWNTVAVVTDGTAVLGLGDIGPEAGMPVMEGKCALFKAFGGVDAVPICLRTKDVEEIVRTVACIAGSFGGINLEDISAPRCIEVERRLKAELDIPVFHDDQHGTAIVVLAALRNALRLTGRPIGEQRVVINGAGSAGLAIARLLLSAGVLDMLLCDRQGILRRGDEMNPEQAAVAAMTNGGGRTGSLADALRGADVFVGVSAPGLVTPEMIRSMRPDPIVFPMANPTPEILPAEALGAGAAVVGSGRSDFPNQINNVLAFPGVFRGALDARARDIDEGMKLAASEAIASLVSEGELRADYILPAAFDPRVRDAVAAAVGEAARASGVARL